MWIDFFGRLLLGTILLSLASITFGLASAFWLLLYDEWDDSRRKRAHRRERGF